MDNVTFVTTTNDLTGETVEHAIIDHGNDQFTSMPKSIYDEQQAAQAEHLNGIVAGDPKEL